MSECCCSKPEVAESIPTGWQCPCCKVVYAPSVDACFCCVEDCEITPDAPEIASPPNAPWHFTFQPPPTFATVSLTVEAVHAEG